MKQISIPSFLHDVFGEKQTVGSILTILLFGAFLTTLLCLVFPEFITNLPLWRSALALLLIFDIFSGCIANFTSSTSNFYVNRRKNRIIFIMIHFHNIIIALLLQIDLWSTVVVWAYTIVGAFIVNAFIKRDSQLFIAGFLLSLGLGVLPILEEMQPYMLTINSLFMLKVLFSFAVDHYRKEHYKMRENL